MVLLDTNVLSILVKAYRLDLLFSIFGDDLAVSPNVRRELEAGIQAGHRVLQPVVDLIRQKRIKIVAPTKTEQQRFPDLSFEPEKGETDSLLYCLEHNVLFLTNDERACRKGKALRAKCALLKSFLRSLWESGLLSKDEVRHLIAELEEKAEMVVKYQTEIFEDATD